MTSQNKQAQSTPTNHPPVTPAFSHPQPQGMMPLARMVSNPVDVQQQIDSLSYRLDTQIQTHKHGQNATRINLNTDIIGLFETVSAAPTIIPTSPYEQIKIYVNGATLRLYWYDSVAHAWHYVTATS